MTVLREVKRVVAEQLGVDEHEVTLDANFIEDLGADSLDVVLLVMALEDNNCGLEIPDEDVEKLATVRDVVAYIDQRQGEP